MDMNKAFVQKKEARDPKWHLIDAKGKIIGRLATQIADKLRGKDKPEYTPHIDTGDYVVVINVDKALFSGDKMRDKEYVRYTGYFGGQKKLTAREMAERKPTFLLWHAVKGMMGIKSKLARAQLKKLKIYTGTEHPHKAQMG